MSTSATPAPVPQWAAPPLAKVHTGMRCNGIRYFNENNRGFTGMRKEMGEHLKTVAREYYAGNVEVVDEFLQLYCFGEEERKKCVARIDAARGAAT